MSSSRAKASLSKGLWVSNFTRKICGRPEARGKTCANYTLIFIQIDKKSQSLVTHGYVHLHTFILYVIDLDVHVYTHVRALVSAPIPRSLLKNRLEGHSVFSGALRRV